MFITAQIMGGIALINLILSYQQKTKKNFLVCQIIANLFYALQYVFLSALSGVTSSIISTVRSIIFYNYQKKDKNIPFVWLVVFILLPVLTLLMVYDNIYSLIPVFIACFYTYGTWQKKLYKTYLIGAIAGFLWIIYSYTIGAWLGLVAGIFELISSLIGLFRIKKV